MIVATLYSVEDKKMIFQNIGAIANLKNQDGNRYIIKDFLTQTALEKQQRQQQIFDMYAGNVEMQKKIKVTKKKGTKSQWTDIQKRIHPPTSQEIMQLSLDELRTILSIKMYAGTPITEQGSQFTGYTAEVQNHQQIRQMYFKLKLTNAEARHIVCAYKIPGSELHHCNDYCDDDEIGTGKFPPPYAAGKQHLQ